MNLRATLSTLMLAFLAVLVSPPSPAVADPADSAAAPSIQALEWRCVGPHIGKRGCGVATHPTDRNVFFHAHSSGGLWKTEDAGQYWVPLTDGQIGVGAVGAVAVSPSNPDVIYIGTGEPQLRDCVSWGDGVYKSCRRRAGGRMREHEIRRAQCTGYCCDMARLSVEPCRRWVR